MRRSKSGKRIGFHILSVLALVLAFCLPVSAGVQEGDGEYEIYPTPQSVAYGTGTVTLTDKVNVTTGDAIDSYTKARIDATLEVLGLEKNASAVAGNTNLIVGVYDSGDAADTWGASHDVDATIYEKFDAYTLWIQGSDIVVLGKNTDAAYYGVTTLKRIFEQLEGKTVKALTVKDYAEVEFRGFIEGYYGNPWSHEDRMDLMKFGGEIKMNQYIYAPKDDPLHNAQWRELYDEAGLKKVSELAQAGNKSKCFYVYALHLFKNDYPLTEANYAEDLEDAKAKFSQVIGAGVRQIAILEDDASSGGRWTNQTLINLLNDMSEWLQEMKKTYPDLKTDLLFCPGWMAYANSMSNPNDGDTQKIIQIQQGVSDNVRIVMTGGKVWGDVTTAFADRFKEKTGTYPYLWVNWPCNDNTKTSTIMGGHNYILQKGLDGSKYRGVVLNPMQESEPSKVGIFTAADFLWKIWDEAQEGDQAWDDSFKYIDHMTAIRSEESDALREVAKHMITQSPTQPQVQFDESVEIKDELTAFRGKMNADSVAAEDVASLREEFVKMNDAVKLYMKQGTNRRLAKQMTPFMSCFRDMTQADIAFLDGITAALSGKDDEVWDLYSEGQKLYEQSHTYGFDYYGSGTIYAEAARKYITPFTEAIMQYLADKVKSVLDPEHTSLKETLIYKVGGVEASGNEGDVAKALDGNPNTNFQIQRNQQTDDYVGMMFNAKVPVSSIRIALACTGHENDYIPNAVMEYTLDGNTWQAFAGQPTENPTTEVSLSFEEMEIRGFRWRGTEIDTNRWLIIREVGYNTEGWESPDDEDDGKYAVSAVTHTSAWTEAQGTQSSLTDGDDSTFVWYDSGQGTGKDSSLAGDFLQIDLGEIKTVRRVRALVGAGDGDKWVKYHLEYSETGVDGSWTALDSYTGVNSGTDTYEMEWDGISARYFRLVNEQDIDKWVKFSEFAAYANKSSRPIQGVEMDYTNTENGGWRVEYGDTSARVIPKQDAVLKPGEYVGLKLDRIHEIASSVVTGTNTDQLKFEQSMNQTVWTDAGRKGAARYIRLINKSDQDVTFRLDSFEVKTNEIFPMDLLDTNIGNNDTGQDARSLGTTRNWMDGELSTAAKYTAPPQAGSYVTYDLGQEIELRSLKLWTRVGVFDYPRDAKVQVALTADENAQWKDVLVIGDGVADGEDTADLSPEQNGWTPGTGAVEVAYAYKETQNMEPVKARYIRLYYTAGYNHRWVELNEIVLNDGETFPSVLDPTFETDAALQQGSEPHNMCDGDLTTAFTTETKEGSLIYHLSESTKMKELKILQSGAQISNAEVSVRTGEDTWDDLGTLDSSLSVFYTSMYEDVYDVKITWNGVSPVIYEIFTLYQTKDEDIQEKLDQDIEKRNNAVSAAQAAVNDADTMVQAAQKKVEAAANELDKLKAELELAEAKSAKAAAEEVFALKSAAAAKQKANLALVEAKILSNAGNEEEAQKKKAEAAEFQKTASDQKELANAKKTEQENLSKDIEDKRDKVDNYKPLEPDDKPNPGGNTQNPSGNTQNPVPKPTITNFNYKNVKYKVLDASKKTVAAVGVTTKKVKSVTVYKTVKKEGTTWKVVEIGAKAFKGCKKLTKVTIGANVTKIGKQAFASCPKLKTVNMKKAAKIKSFGKKAFSKINAKARITVPAKKRAKYKRLLKKAGVPKKAVIK